MMSPSKNAASEIREPVPDLPSSGGHRASLEAASSQSAGTSCVRERLRSLVAHGRWAVGELGALVASIILQRLEQLHAAYEQRRARGSAAEQASSTHARAPVEAAPPEHSLHRTS